MSGQFLTQREYLNQGDLVRLDCDTQCNFMILDDSNFSAYRNGRRYKYYGGHYKRFPAQIAVPYPGHWNVVIDLGGGSAAIRYNVSFVKRG